MRYRKWTTSALLTILALGLGIAAGQTPNGTPGPSAGPQGDTPLTPAQVQALMTRAIENQHSDDQALDEYERIEREVERTVKNPNGPTVETIFHVVPTGLGTARIVIQRNGKPTDPAVLKEQWQNVAEALETHSDPNDSRTKQDREKADHRRRERSEMEDAVLKAFHFRWVGRTEQDHHWLIEIAFDPDPNFRSTVRFANLYGHVHGTIWLDETSGHMAKMVADLNDDISFYGLLARIYRGGRFTTEQVEADPGVWLPARITYDFDGRKLVFPAAIHERAEISEYRRLGPPGAALVLIRKDHPDITAKRP